MFKIYINGEDTSNNLRMMHIGITICYPKDNNEGRSGFVFNYSIDEWVHIVVQDEE